LAVANKRNLSKGLVYEEIIANKMIFCAIDVLIMENTKDD